MAKRFKLKFTIPSFQLCRSKTLSNLPGNPVPAIYRLSPVNPKTRDTGCPNLPSPPTSMPEHHHCNVCHSRSRAACKEQQQQHVPFVNSRDLIHCGSTFCKTKLGGDHNNSKKVKLRGRKSTSSVPSGRSDFLIDQINEEESETLISSLTSFSDEFCHDNDETVLHNSPSTSSHELGKGLIKSRPGRTISSVKKVQRLRFQASSGNNGFRGSESTRGQVKKMTVMSSSRSSRASSMARCCTVEGKKVKESFAVVKKSRDPYEDFKKSMMEMIAEMEMFAAEDLEQLLQCFLALNSRSYHGVIVRAFMEIWQQMFCVKPSAVAAASTKNLLTYVKSPNDVEE